MTSHAKSLGNTIRKKQSATNDLENVANLKGKLAHNFMVSCLVLISCLGDMIRTYLTEEMAKINIFCS